jgi:phospholipid/cholesterol/gamma-HCH transport system substrate-binding protein
MLETQQEEVASLIQHLNAVGKSLDEANLGQVAEGIIAVSNQFELLLDKVNSGEGSVGKLIHSDSLHRSLEMLVTDLDELIRDLQENPEDYVQISVFGRSKREN